MLLRHFQNLSSIIYWAWAPTLRPLLAPEATKAKENEDALPLESEYYYGKHNDNARTFRQHPRQVDLGTYDMLY